MPPKGGICALFFVRGDTSSRILFFFVSTPTKRQVKKKEKKLIMSLDFTKERRRALNTPPGRATTKKRVWSSSPSPSSSFPSCRERARVVVVVVSLFCVVCSRAYKREEQLIDVCTRCAFASRRRGRTECVVSFPRATTGPEPTQHQTERRRE